MSYNPGTSLALAVVFSAFPLLAVSSAQAEQFTFFDLKYTATEQNSNTPVLGHYDIREGGDVKFTQPANWTSPIDYTKGTVVVELDSIEKPSPEVAQIDICLLTAKGYGCRNTTLHTTPGRYQLVRPMPTAFYQYMAIDWTQKITHVQLVTKDAANTNGGKDQKKFFPHTSRIAITFVAPGSTYVLPPGWTAAPGADAGVSGPSDASASDATSTPADAKPPTTADAPTSGAGGAGGSAPSGMGGSLPTGSSGGTSGGSGGGSGGAPSSSGSGGSSGAGTGGRAPSNPGKPDPAPSTPGTSAPSKSGGCSMAAASAKSSLPATLLPLGLIFAGIAVRRRRSRTARATPLFPLRRLPGR